MQRIASLDLLRGLAAFSVALPHFLIDQKAAAELLEPVSVLSVEVFFVLSGYVLAPQILFCLQRNTFAAVKIFLIRRWMRTVPPYLVALGLISYLAEPLVFADVVRYTFYVQNLFGQHNTYDYFPVAWSLSIEEWFYVIFPVMVLLCGRIADRVDRQRLCIGLTVGFIAAVTVARTIFGDYADWGFEVRRVVVFRIDSIAYGFLLYIVLHDFAKTFPHKRSAVTVSFVVLILVAAVAGFVTFQIGRPGNDLGKHLFPFLAAAFGGSAIVAMLTVSRPLQGVPWLSALSVFLGRISYSIYLFHLVFIVVLRSSVEVLPLAVQFACYVVCILALPAVFYHVFERPILAARPGYGSPDSGH